jgi:hypothetical protein
VTWRAEPGATFLCPTGGVLHLFVVVSERTDLAGEPSGQVLVVNFSSVPGEGIPYDATCVVDAGAHPFIDRPSYVVFRYARKLVATVVERNVATGLYPAKPPLGSDVVRSIRENLIRSPHTPRYIKRHVERGEL